MKGWVTNQISSYSLFSSGFQFPRILKFLLCSMFVLSVLPFVYMLPACIILLSLSAWISSQPTKNSTSLRRWYIYQIDLFLSVVSERLEKVSKCKLFFHTKLLAKFHLILFSIHSNSTITFSFGIMFRNSHNTIVVT